MFLPSVSHDKRILDFPTVKQNHKKRLAILKKK